MPLASAFLPWFHAHGGLDLHVLPGLASPRLDHLIFLAYTGPDQTVRADAPRAGTAVAFSAAFAGAPSAHGVTVDAATGRVTVANPLPAARLRSFVVSAVVTDAGVAVTAPRVRVHVHGSVTRLWLTPAPLTVRQGAKNMRFTVLALFDDGVIGDVSNWAPFRTPGGADETFATLGGAAFLTWTSAAPGTVGVDARTGELTAQVPAGNADISASAGPLPPPPALTAKAQARCAPPWSTPVRLTPLGGARFDRIATSRNVLFLPDGFTAAERLDFQRLAAEVVSRLQRNLKTRPFDLLAPNINYFAAWVPSPEAGISALDELHPGHRPWEPQEVPYPQPPDPAKPWELSNLVDAAGLPAPALDAAGSPLGPPAGPGRLHEWQTLYGAAAVPAAKVTAALHTSWLALRDRILVNEKDTAFHFAFASRPGLSDPDAERTVSRNPRRTTPQDVDVFLDALRDAAGNPLPVAKVWATGGLDDSNVLVLCRSRHFGGANAVRAKRPAGGGSSHTIGMAVGDNDSHVVAAVATGWAVTADPVPARLRPTVWLRAAHEIAHSWTLDDEYRGGTPINLPDLATTANVQPRSELLVGGVLSPANLKWVWPRIAHAGVLTADPVQIAGGFQLKLRAGHTITLADVVRVRTRPLVGSAQSRRWKVTKAGATEVEVQPLAGTPPDELKTFTLARNSIVIAPVRAPDPDAARDAYGADLSLVAASVLAHMQAQHNPLNAALGAPPDRPWDDTIDQERPTKATNIVKPSPRPKFSAWLVGLFEEGANAPRDVYRPTGICLMRRKYISRGPLNRQLPDSAPQVAYQFCPVCRYAMVDLIDPVQHGAIDADYAKRYPA